MRPYEVMVILDPGLEDQALEATVRRSTEAISSRGGQVNRTDRWGRRRLAYEIDHKVEGVYVLFDVTAEPAVMDDLDRSLRLADEVIRHKIVRLPDHVAGRPRRLSEVEPVAAAATGSTSVRRRGRPATWSGSRTILWRMTSSASRRDRSSSSSTAGAAVTSKRT